MPREDPPSLGRLADAGPHVLVGGHRGDVLALELDPALCADGSGRGSS